MDPSDSLPGGLDRNGGPLPFLFLQRIQGMQDNDVCFDCPAHSPEWASVSHGTLVCLQCAGRHRTLGVHVSRIKSLTMDAWEPQHVAAMLLSGNAQVKGFFKRQKVHNSHIEDLYPRVRAADFYRMELAKQVDLAMGQLAAGLPCVLDQVAATVYESPSPSPSASPETTPKHATTAAGTAASATAFSASSGSSSSSSDTHSSGNGYSQVAPSSSSSPADWGDAQEGPGCEYFEAAIHSQGLGMTLAKEQVLKSASSPNASVARVVRVAPDGDAAKAGVVPGDVVCGVTPGSSNGSGSGSRNGVTGRGFVHPCDFDALMASLARCGPNARPLQLVVRRPASLVDSRGHAPSPSSEKAQQRLYTLLGNHAKLGKGPLLSSSSSEGGSASGNGDQAADGSGGARSSPRSPPTPTVQRAPGAKPRVPPAQPPFLGGTEISGGAVVATAATAPAAASADPQTAELTTVMSALSLVRAYYPTAASTPAATETTSEISDEDVSSATAPWASSLTINTEVQEQPPNEQPPLFEEDASANSAAMPDWLREATIDHDATSDGSGGADAANLTTTATAAAAAVAASTSNALPPSSSSASSGSGAPPATVAWGQEFDATFSGARLGFRLERDPSTGCGRVGPVVPYEAAASFGVKPGDALVAVAGVRQDRYDALLHWLGPGAPRPLTLTFRKDSDKPPPVSLSVGSAEAAAARLTAPRSRGSPGHNGEVSYPGYPSARSPQQAPLQPQYPGYPSQQPQYHQQHYQQHYQQPPPWAPAAGAAPPPYHHQQRPGAPLSPPHQQPPASRVGELPAPGSGQRGRAAHMRSPLEDAAIELGGILSASMSTLLKDTGGPAPPYRPRAPPPNHPNGSGSQHHRHPHGPPPSAAPAPPPPPWAPPTPPPPMPGAPPSSATGFGAQYTFPAELVPSNGGLMSTKVDLGALTEVDEVDISFVAGPLGMRLDERGGLLPVSVVTKIEPNGQAALAGVEVGCTVVGINGERVISHAHTISTLKHGKRPIKLRLRFPDA